MRTPKICAFAVMNITIEPPSAKMSPISADAYASFEFTVNGKASISAAVAAAVTPYPLTYPTLSTSAPKKTRPNPLATAARPPIADWKRSSAITAPDVIPNRLYSPESVRPGVNTISPISQSRKKRFELTASRKPAPGGSHTSGGSKAIALFISSSTSHSSGSSSGASTGFVFTIAAPLTATTA